MTALLQAQLRLISSGIGRAEAFNVAEDWKFRRQRRYEDGAACRHADIEA
jgi:hypothetical protein